MNDEYPDDTGPADDAQAVEWLTAQHQRLREAVIAACGVPNPLAPDDDLIRFLADWSKTVDVHRAGTVLKATKDLARTGWETARSLAVAHGAKASERAATDALRALGKP